MRKGSQMAAKRVPTALKFNAAVQGMPSKMEYKTGFPEPLSPDRNTTLPHPSADTSPNACIESTDVPLSRTHSRVSSRHSFGFGHRHKSSRADGPIDMSAFPSRSSGDSIDGVLEAAAALVDGDAKAKASGNGNRDGNANGNVTADADADAGLVAQVPNATVAMAGGDAGRESSEASFEKGRLDGIPKKRGSVLRKFRMHKS